MKPCREYLGRQRDLCEGRGRDGRPDPTQEAIDAFAAKESRSPVKSITASNPKKQMVVQSTVGTHLAAIFTEKVDAIPCSACKQKIIHLNSLTVPEAISQRAAMIEDISSRAARSASKWWQKVAIVADQAFGTGVTSHLVGVYYDQACMMAAADVSRTVVKPVVQTVTQVKRIVEPKQYTRPDADWAVAVTTAPRGNENTLAVCLDSLITAGWYDPVVFAEPGSDVPRGIKVIHNETKRGCWHNWLYSATHTLANTSASIIMTVQDDSLFHPDSREFVEAHCLWPTEDTGIVSLYTAAHYSEEKGGALRPCGINHVHTGCWWGTCAVVWRRESLQAVVEHDLSKKWLGLSPKKMPDENNHPELRRQRVDAYYEARKANPSLINNSDYIAGHVLNMLGLKMFFIDPSPVQHVSRVSTLKHGGNTGKRNCRRCADHAIPLKNQVGTTVNVEEPKNLNQLKYPKIIKPGVPVAEPGLSFLIRSSYSNEDVSRYRWKITQQTLLASLRAQADKRFTVELICSEADAMRDEKFRAFADVANTSIAPPDWYNRPHDGLWRRIARVDDDDVIANDFTELINAVPCDGVECLLSFPSGYMLTKDAVRNWKYPSNMFCIVQTNTRFTPYHVSHRHLRKIMPTVIVSDLPSWAWVRHAAALSFSERKTKQRCGETITALEHDRFSVDVREIQQLCAVTSYPVDTNKTGTLDKDVCRRVEVSSLLSRLADKYETDKGIHHSSRSHQYAIIYEQLFAAIKDQVTHVLEIGIGTSLYMWAEYFQNAVIHGLDRKQTSITGDRVVIHQADAVDSYEFGCQFDLIVEDAGHVSSETRRAFSAHGKHVKLGGYYVIESLHAMRMQVMTPQNKWIDESPDMLETCRQWALTPPNGWDCVLYGDQLCVLQKKNTQ